MPLRRLCLLGAGALALLACPTRPADLPAPIVTLRAPPVTTPAVHLTNLPTKGHGAARAGTRRRRIGVRRWDRRPDLGRRARALRRAHGQRGPAGVAQDRSRGPRVGAAIRGRRPSGQRLRRRGLLQGALDRRRNHRRTRDDGHLPGALRAGRGPCRGSGDTAATTSRRSTAWRRTGAAASSSPARSRRTSTSAASP